MTLNCWNCKFWFTNYPYLEDRRAEQSNHGVYSYVGDCRRRAPKWAGKRNVRAWPQTSERTCCGDHQPRVEWLAQGDQGVNALTHCPTCQQIKGHGHTCNGAK